MKLYLMSLDGWIDCLFNKEQDKYWLKMIKTLLSVLMVSGFPSSIKVDGEVIGVNIRQQNWWKYS